MWSYISHYLWIYFVRFICQNSSWFLHRHWGNSVTAHWQWSIPYGYWWKNDSSTTQAETKRKPIARYAVIRIIMSDDNAFHCDYTRHKWHGTEVNKAFSNSDSHTHTYTYNCLKKQTKYAFNETYFFKWIWCTAYNDLWPWPIPSRLFSPDFAIKLLNC